MLLNTIVKTDEQRSCSTPTGPRANLGAEFGIATSLILLNLLVFARSFSGYFLADDFVHVSWLWDVFQSNPLRLLENFTGNWMQAQGTQFYRPIISLTLASDYFIGRGSPLVFHATNIAFQCGCTVLLYAMTRLLLRTNAALEARSTAFVAAALFAASPLHPEVVSWIIGRVDSVCLFFFLASTTSYLWWSQSQKKMAAALSLITAALALGSKEMAVILPAVIMMAESFELKGMNFYARVRRALVKTAPWWALLAGYFALRWFALGNLVGGYNGSVGDGFAASLWKRLSDGSLTRVILPFNRAVFAGKDILFKLLPALYLLSALVGLARLTSLRKQSGFSPVIGFAAGWLLMAFLPALPVWNLTETLQCSRFAYAATAPLSLLGALLLMPVWTKVWQPADQIKKIWFVAGAALSLALIAVYSLITVKNNIPWAHASAQVRDFRQAIVSEQEKNPGKQLAILNVPNQMNGAHMIYNGAMLSVLLSPPLTKTPMKVHNFEAVTYGDPDLISSARVRRLASQSNAPVFYKWNETRRQLQQFPVSTKSRSFDLLKCSAISAKHSVDQASATVRFVSPHQDFCATDVDFVRCAVQIPHVLAQPKHIYLFWSSQDEAFSAAKCLTLPLESGTHTYTFAVGQHKSWISSGKVDRICIEIPQENTATLLEVKAISGEQLAPDLSCESMTEGFDGIIQLDRPATFRVDAGAIDAAASVELEISSANAWFEHYSGTLKDSKRSQHAARRLQLDKNGLFQIKPEDFPHSAYYQLRALPLDAHGLPVGSTSDPLNLQVSR